MALRTTQRAPRSCFACSSRKVKCDKNVPCSTCIKRGQADACAREMVIVRGAVTTWTDSPDLLTYDELRAENQRLRDEIELLKRQQVSCSPSSRGEKLRRSLGNDDELEKRLWKLVSASSPASPTATDWGSIMMPSRRCSEQLVEFDRIWNSWVHYALEYPTFENECDEFYAEFEKGGALEDYDPAWLAVYFAVLCAALLMMAEDEASHVFLPQGFDQRRAGKMWYDASIFCLHRSDFMRTRSIRSVQAVAILGMCFNNWGDSDLDLHLWSCALRIAQSISLHNPPSSATDILSAEGQRRLWWTLMIVEWMRVPYQIPQVDEVDFDMSLPVSTMTPDEKMHIDPVHYHIFMARAATAYYRFCVAIRAAVKPVEEAVRKADEELAEVINTLPEYLKPDNSESEHVRQLEEAQPWVKWQRFDVTVVLLHLRVRINRALQAQWQADPQRYSWAKTISVTSAMSVIWINHNWDQPASMRKQWALSFHVFVAATLLLREHQTASSDQDEAYWDSMNTALYLLDQVKDQSAVAQQAAAILRAEISKG
ncbi:unnamed protein product [Clonostachys rosea f. rosea IK726]|uniref:Zn(2)-C6 fungal-type domain-containing protein n=2 Tax=Bionectria ochroleuca TaxID=29856 RepID=A0A0B7KBQ1_BIOOC|nr:unnamed protein product [Clonostachys rosea f. rosea IK726]